MVAPLPDQKALRLFYVYAHKDERLRKRLETSLALLRRQGWLHEWHDRKIGAGKEWRGEIATQLEAADIILLLVSPDFLASDYCYDIEMKRALARHEEGTARVVPIIVRTVGWQTTLLEKLQALPKDGKPVDCWAVRDAAWADIEEGIRRITQEFQPRQQLMPLTQATINNQQNPPVPRRYALLRIHSSQEGPRFFLPFDKTLIVGRDEQADIRLPEDDKKTSRGHCRIRWSANGIEVFDWPSKNGTFVNEQRIDQARLQLGDYLRCGRTVFRLEDFNATESEDTDEQ